MRSPSTEQKHRLPPRKVRQLRQQHGLTVAEMATRVGISKAMMSKIENAQTSCSLSTPALLAKGFDVPVTSRFRGTDVERPAAFVNAGTGARIVRNGTTEGHGCRLLGSRRGEHKRLECLLVTRSETSRTYPLFQHPGTEFIYTLDAAISLRQAIDMQTPEASGLWSDAAAARGSVMPGFGLPARVATVVACSGCSFSAAAAGSDPDRLPVAGVRDAPVESLFTPGATP